MSHFKFYSAYLKINLNMNAICITAAISRLSQLAQIMASHKLQHTLMLA